MKLENKAGPLLGIIGVGVMTVSCLAETNNTPQSTAIPSFESNPSVRVSKWVDAELARSGHPLLSTLEFYFHQGDLKLLLCFKEKGEFRITSHQNNFDPGYLYNKPEDITQHCVLRNPVIDVVPDEEDEVGVGTRAYDQPYDNTYNQFRYRIRREGNTPEIKVEKLGQQVVNPGSIVPRDPETADKYFRR